MADVYSPGSFTKNFGSGVDYQKLVRAISKGFQGELKPISRQDWRKNAGNPDRARDLIPLNFFLFNKDDNVLVDEFVEQCVKGPYDRALDRLSLFVFHLANSGHWKEAERLDGRIAGWCNEFALSIWTEYGWHAGALTKKNLDKFIDGRVSAYKKTKVKVRNNYWYFLKIAGALDPHGEFVDLQPQEWGVSACKIFWDRLTYQGMLSKQPTKSALLAAFNEHEIYKLMSCSEELGNEIAKGAADEYLKMGTVQRFR